MVSHNTMDHFDHIIGYEEIKEELRKLVSVLKEPERYRKIGGTNPHGLLLHGEPGLGKTMSAECFMEEMKEAGWQTRTIRREETSEEYIQKVKEIFEEAGTAGHYIILLDDIDKASEGDLNQVTPSEYSVIQSFIDAVKDKSVFVIATANRLGTLPDSLLRAGRFDKQVYFDMPAFEDRKKIIKYYLRDKKIEPGVFEDAATMLSYRSCAEIDTVLNEAALLAGFYGREEISLEDLKWAVMEIIYDWDRAESANSDDPVLKKYIAYHEAGHVLAREYYFPESVRLVTILPCTHHEQGMTVSESGSDDELWNTAIEGTIVSHLAGRAAINLKLCEYPYPAAVSKDACLLELNAVLYKRVYKRECLVILNNLVAICHNSKRSIVIIPDICSESFQRYREELRRLNRCLANLPVKSRGKKSFPHRAASRDVSAKTVPGDYSAAVVNGSCVCFHVFFLLKGYQK